MPLPGKCWYHIVINTRGSWLHGDKRGFRSRHHRIHSSGDYKRPLPPEEHAGLRAYQQRHGREAVRLPSNLHPIIGQRMIDKISEQAHCLLVLSVDTHHAHLLVELPEERNIVKKLVSSWKQAASHAVRDQLSGRVWSRDSNPTPIRNESHHQQVYRYIRDHKNQAAWVWTFREGVVV